MVEYVRFRQFTHILVHDQQVINSSFEKKQIEFYPDSV